MQRHADHRALYVRARRKIHVMRSALFFRRARRLGHDVRVPTWLGHDVRARPSEWQNLEAGVDLLGIGSLCGRPTCALRSLDLIQCRGLLAALSAGQSHVFLVRPQIRHELVAVCDNCVGIWISVVKRWSLFPPTISVSCTCTSWRCTMRRWVMLLLLVCLGGVFELCRRRLCTIRRRLCAPVACVV